MIKAEKITLHRAEGPSAECITVEVRTFAEAERVLRKWRETAPGPGGGYDKTDFIVHYADGETYIGRIDLERENPETSDLAGHMNDSLKFYTGEFCPPHMTQNEYETYLSTYANPENRVGSHAWLRTYQIGDAA